MKKRFTIMLDEKVIRRINIAKSYVTPSAFREDIEKWIDNYANDYIFYWEKEREKLKNGK